MDVLEVRGIEGKRRFYYLDNLKIFLTCLVIAHHASQAYGPTGGAWAYHNSNGTLRWLGHFMAVNAAYFMGLFFMISGFFVPPSYQGKKIGVFIKKKLNRLMLPVLVILVLVVPIYFYFAAMLYEPNAIGFLEYYINIYWRTGLISYEHGWFMVHLFFYGMIYALVMKLIENKDIKAPTGFRAYYLCIMALLIGVISHYVRLAFPIDRWIILLGFIGMELAHVPQYIIFFIFGIFAYKYNYMEEIPKRKGFIFGIVGIIMALVVYSSYFSIIWPFTYKIWDYWAFYESFMAVFISIGLVVVFREFCNWTNGFYNILAESAFGAYVIHNLFVVILQVKFDAFLFSPWVKFISVSGLSIIFSFGAAYLFILAKAATKRMVKKILSSKPV